MIKYAKLFSPVTVGGMTVKNRIFMPPMSTHLADEGGGISEALLAYFKRRADGGAGMVTVASILIEKLSRYGSFRNIGLFDDEQITAMRLLTGAIHLGGAKACAQLLHPSSSCLSRYNEGRRPVAASAVGARISPEIPRSITKDEIAVYVRMFSEAALRARAAGFDAVEIHCCHRHGLLGNFLSPLHNKRIDDYGGNVDGRLKMPLQVMSAVREAVGHDYPLIVRMSATDEECGGQTLEEGVYIAQQFEKAGASMIHLSDGNLDIPWMTTAPGGTPQGFNEPYAAVIKKAVNIPLAFVGRITEARAAEGILERGAADALYIGRALLADPDFPCKALNGEESTIRPCIGCMRCLSTVNADGRICCTMNPEAGRETEPEPEYPEIRGRKLLVIGGGPAGLTAASYAARYGFDVTLMEKSGRLGGRMYLAGIPPCKHDVTNGLKYMIKEAEAAGVGIVTGREVKKEDIYEYDAVIAAVGGDPAVPDFLRGAEKLVTAEDVLDGRENVGRNIVIVGGGPVGCEIADYVADPHITFDPLSRRVTIVELLDTPEANESGAARSLLMQRLLEKRVSFLTSTKVTKTDGRMVECLGEGGKIVIRDVDTVIAAIGTKQNNELPEMIRTLGIPGECVTDTADIYAAVSGGRNAARRIYERLMYKRLK